MDPVGVRDSAHVGRLTPSGPRLGSSRVCGPRAVRGTSLCSLFSLPFVLWFAYGLLVLGVSREAALLASVLGGGPWVPGLRSLSSFVGPELAPVLQNSQGPSGPSPPSRSPLVRSEQRGASH